MKIVFTIALLLIISCGAYSQKHKIEIHTGINYRQFPIDIEDISVTSSGPYQFMSPDLFWRCWNITGSIARPLSYKWMVLLTGYSRYNHFYWKDPPTNYDNDDGRAERKNFKYDLFFDIERKIRFHKMDKGYMTVLAGMGFTNLNTAYDFYYKQSTPFGPVFTNYYKGSFLHFGPRVSLGYERNRFQTSLDAFIIEGPDMNNLTSLWLGASVYYIFRKRNK